MPELCFEAYGLRARVEAEDPELYASLPKALPPGWRATSAPGAVSFQVAHDGTVTCNGVRADVGEHVTDPLTALGLAVRHHVAEHAPHHIFLHAGVVAVASRAILIPGQSRSGKTALVEELVRAGALYMSDEYAAVDPTGLIHPYPKPLVLRPGTKRYGAIELTSDQIASQPARAALVLVTHYEPGSRWQPRPLTTGEAALALLENAVPARQRPSDTVLAIGAVSRGAAAISSKRGEAHEVAKKILQFVADGR